MSDESTTAAQLEDYEPPPIPFGVPDELGPDADGPTEPVEPVDEELEPDEEDGGGGSEEVGEEDRPVEIAAGDTRVEFISHEQTSLHRIGGTSAVRSFVSGAVRVKRASATNDDVQTVTIHRDTLGALHLLLSEDPPNIDAIRALLPPLVS